MTKEEKQMFMTRVLERAQKHESWPPGELTTTDGTRFVIMVGEAFALAEEEEINEPVN